MTRNTHDMDLDHHGTADAERIASGTPTSGYVPVAAGAGTPAAWTTTSGFGSSVHLENDDSTFTPRTGVAFTDGATLVISDGSSATTGQFLELSLSLGKAQMASFASGGSQSYAAFMDDGEVNIGGESASGAVDNYIQFIPDNWVVISSLSSGPNSAFLYVEADNGNIEMYPSNHVYMNPAVDVVMQAGGDVDCSATSGLFFPPAHSSDPTGAEGGCYYNTTTHKLRVYNGTTWQDCN